MDTKSNAAVAPPTVKRPGDLILTSRDVVQVQADGSVKPWKRPSNR